MSRFNDQRDEQQPRDPQDNYYYSLPKIMYGLMKELQRANALKALEIRLGVEDNDSRADEVDEEVERIMSTDPAGRYGKGR